MRSPRAGDIYRHTISFYNQTNYYLVQAVRKSALQNEWVLDLLCLYTTNPNLPKYISNYHWRNNIGWERMA